MQVTVENFIRVLTGRLPPSTPRSKRLLSDDRSNILVYMTGKNLLGFLRFLAELNRDESFHVSKNVNVIDPSYVGFSVNALTSEKTGVNWFGYYLYRSRRRWIPQVSRCRRNI